MLRTKGCITRIAVIFRDGNKATHSTAFCNSLTPNVTVRTEQNDIITKDNGAPVTVFENPVTNTAHEH
jgi:hypothetical protein